MQGAYLQDWYYLPSMSIRKYLSSPPPQIQQMLYAESTAGTSPSLAHGPRLPPPHRGLLEPEVRGTLCLCALPFSPSEDFVSCLLFPVAFISNCRKKEIICPDFHPKTALQLRKNKDEIQSSPPFPHNSVLPSLHGTRDTPAIALSYCQRGRTSQSCRGPSGRFSGVSEQEYIVA